MRDTNPWTGFPTGTMSQHVNLLPRGYCEIQPISAPRSMRPCCTSKRMDGVFSVAYESAASRSDDIDMKPYSTPGRHSTDA